MSKDQRIKELESRMAKAKHDYSIAFEKWLNLTSVHRQDVLSKGHDETAP